MHKHTKTLFALTVIILFGCLAGICCAEEGFLLIKDDTFLHKDKECKVNDCEKPLYKFTIGKVIKEEDDKIYVKIMGKLLEQRTAPEYESLYYLSIKIGYSGWIKRDDVILFQYILDKNSWGWSEVYENAQRIFLKKYFP